MRSFRVICISIPSPRRSKTASAPQAAPPIEIPAIGVCDGIAMNHAGMFYSLPSREHIADSVEIMATAHPFDGLVLIPNCDKIVPGMMMAALRLNIPALICSGGPMLPGRVKGAPNGPHRRF